MVSDLTQVGVVGRCVVGVMSDQTQVGVVGCDREVCSGCGVRSNTGGCCGV